MPLGTSSPRCLAVTICKYNFFVIPLERAGPIRQLRTSRRRRSRSLSPRRSRLPPPRPVPLLINPLPRLLLLPMPRLRSLLPTVHCRLQVQTRWKRLPHRPVPMAWLWMPRVPTEILFLPCRTPCGCLFPVWRINCKLSPAMWALWIWNRVRPVTKRSRIWFSRFPPRKFFRPLIRKLARLPGSRKFLLGRRRRARPLSRLPL